MNIYHISQSVNRGYDTYDSAVVTAESEEDARQMYPGGEKSIYDFNDWCKPNDVEVELVGTITINESKVICASFNTE